MSVIDAVDAQGSINLVNMATTSYALFAQAPTVPHAEVASLVRARRLYGRGIGWIHAHLLASTMVSHSALYTADAPLQELAASLGVAYLH